VASSPPSSSASTVVLLAAALLTGWAVLTVIVRASLHGFGFDPWIFAMVIQFFAGATLLTAAGFKALPTAPLRRPATWFIGLLRVVTTCGFSAALVHATAGQVTLLVAVNMLLASLGVGAVFGRWPRFREVPGFLLILGGLALLTTRLEGGWHNPAVLLILASESTVVVASLLTERHPDNLGDRRARLALTGFVTLLAAAGLMLVWTLAGTVLPGVIPGPSSGAVAASLGVPALWAIALGLGAVLRGPSTYAAFLLTARIGADGYMISMAALAPVTYGVEALVGATGLLPPPLMQAADLGIMAAIVGGGVWIMAMRTRRRRIATG
jgi:hypothetical protein